MPSAPLWTVTFADMMGLLLAFFILLASFSTISDKKISLAVGSLQREFGKGVMPGQGQSTQAIRAVNVLREMQARVPRGIEKAARELQTRLQVLGMTKGVDIKYDGDGGLLISLPNQILFDFGRAELKPDAYEVINQLGASLSEVKGVFVEVRGHTDNVPLGSQSPYQDNYDLSYHRAKNVMSQLAAPGGVQTKDCEVIACGDSQPVADNATEEGRQTNRRVELHIRGKMSESTLDSIRGGFGASVETPSEAPSATNPNVGAGT
ncbi:MAG: OmpA family protein [Candidatus Hydrogenedentales bacterium]